MRVEQPFKVVKTSLTPARISRSLATILVITLIQVTSAIHAPVSSAAAGNVGSATNSGSCSSAVGEQNNVTATFDSTNGFCLIKFNSGTSWTVPAGVTAIDVLVVGGGGGGGSDGGGGGGGGEVRLATGISVSASNSATVTVGAGGIGNIHGQSNGTNGGISSIVVNGTTVTAYGGLKSVNWQSAEYYAPGGSGGSGGTQLTGATNFSKGGRNSIQTPGYLTGFGTVGYAGVTTSFTGISTVFAGGGGGGICTNEKADPSFGGLAGGAGGGGRGSYHTQYVTGQNPIIGSDAGQPGTDGLGGGGGGGAACNDGGTDLVNARTAGGAGGKGVVYIKFVPVISLSSNPQSATGAVGSTVTFTAAPFPEISATRTKKWQVLVPGGSWSDISGATGSDSYTTPTITRSMHLNQYRYVVTDTVSTMASTTNSSAATLSVTAPAQGDSDTALSIPKDATTVANTTVAGGEAVKPLATDSFTAEAWFLPTDTCTAGYCNLLGREGDWLLAFNDGLMYLNIYNSTGWGGWNSSGVNIPLNQWSHVALTKSTSSLWTLYINGAKTFSITLTYSPNASNTTYGFFVGSRTGGTWPIRGSIDEVKLWKTDRASSIASDMNSTTTNVNALVAYWNFNEASSVYAYNQVAGAAAGTDITISTSTAWDADSVSSQTSRGSYTVRTFKRSYLTLNGGWKSPTGITRVTTILVAGGGGGGGGLNGGGGGAGGFIETTNSITQATYYPITVGSGGVGFLGRGTAGNLLSLPSNTNGSNSVALGFTAIGGGYGAVEYSSPNDHYPASTGGSGGGGSWGNNSSNYLGKSGTTGQGNKGGDSGSISDTYAGAGGGGAGGVGQSPTTTAGGVGGAGKLSAVLGINVAGGGGGGRRNGSNAIGAGGAGGIGGGGLAASANATPNTTNGAQSGATNTGGGGGGGVRQTDGTDGKGAQGGSGVVAVRWITASAPTYTKPVNAYLNVGMTETFTTNVAVDSATVDLTRTFKWESTTPTANGTYTLIKQGTGAANAAFSWVPSDTTTSGSGYLYRLTVTDSDTAGLFITDSSTAYAVINRALNVSGQATIPKAINVTKSETFTITLGTPTYRASLTPTITGITLDTSTAGIAILKVAESVTVGTYYETLTVTDSVSASIVTPLTIVVAAPPNLVNSGEIANDGIIFNLDFANTASFNRTTKTASDLSGLNKPITILNSPTFNEGNLGYMPLKGASNQYISASGFSTMSKWTIDTYFKIDTLAYTCLATTEGTASNWTRNLGLCLDADGSMYAGFFNGTSWTYKRTTASLPTNTWVHVVAQWDGLTTAASTSIKIWFNNDLQASNDVYTADTSASVASKDRVLIHHDPLISGSVTAAISLGYLRIYNRALSETEVAQNFNATKYRFLSANGDLASPSQKYGSRTTETFTATSGYGTDVLTYSTGTRHGLRFDTSGAVTNLQLQESLTVGAYYDTITVTDSLGQSTYLPISMTVTKADTITVSMSNSLSTVYNGSAPAGAPKASITGLVGVDTATVATGYYSLSCAQGGICKVGDVGPGGGTVFYVSKSPINAADGVSTGGLYLEIAPKNWNGNGSGEAPSSFATNLASVSGTSTNIGTGAENTRLWRAALGDSATAVTLALNKTSGGVSDWFVPSYGELTTAITTLQPLGKGSFESYANLWSSTQNATDSTRANNAWSANPPTLNSLLKTDNYYLRPIRAFSPTVGETSTPIDVETYTAMGTNLSFLIGAASNYQAVVYETGTLKITQANQNKLTINLYGAVAGLPFTIQVSGGSGTGAITETITAGSTATNCQVVNHVLSNSNAAGDQKTCNIRVTKAASRNYFEESTTATVYFMAFVDNQPRSQVGSGSTIGLNGINQIWAEPGTAPTISTFTASGARGSTITINGSGFNTPTLIVEFNFYQVASTVNLVSPTQLTVVVPAGATTGPIVVTNSYSSAFSGTDFTVG
jgi:hypothetical protein